MADVPGSSSENSDKNTELDEKLDLFSDKFDPLAFLYSDKTKIPYPKAKTFDNLAMWHSNYKRGGDAPKRGKKVDKSDVPARRWLPHQLPVASKPTRIQKNVFTRMEAMQGPLAVLRKYVEEKTRIKIITRKEKGIRGYCNGFLLAFDKHFNLLLQEVDEVWRRSIKVKTNPVFLDLTPDDSPDGNIQHSKNHVRIPKIETKKISKNTEECRRHVDQMLMRGEHVVLICVPAAEEEKKIIKTEDDSSPGLIKTEDDSSPGLIKTEDDSSPG